MNKLKSLLLASVAVCLIAADAQSSSTNSLVRFRLVYGSTFFGDVDVELFDDKPLTVANFLANVGNGIYDNSILHDLRPGYTVQGGVGSVGNPYSNEPFELITRVPTNAPVPNEVGVGAPRSNAFGTLAMAKNAGDTNSASASWFFNLGNNGDGFGVTNLDASLGGYTVFGHVVKGSNVLAFFNTFTEDNGVQNMTNDFHLGLCPPLYLLPDGINIGFDALPVGFFGLDCVRYSDLFNVQVILLNGTTDVQAPKVAITFPPTSPGVSGDIIPVVGTSSDNVAVETVRVYLNTNAPVTASGTAVWSALLSGVPAGTNVVVAEAIDSSGNRAQTTRTFFHSVLAPLSLQTVGSGTITGPAHGALLEVNRGYTLVAKPAPGYLFAGYTGTVSQLSATLPFLMESNFAVTALFVTNQFPRAKGSYNGLFYNTNIVDQGSSGFLTLTLGDLGSYSARLYMNGRNYRFSGSFSTTGGATNLIDRTGTNALLVRMAVDLFGGDHLIGSVTNNQISFIDTNASWSAEIMADRAVFNAQTNPTSLAGNYTLIIPADTNSTAGPDGDGFATVAVTTAGAVSLTSTLADGTKAVQKVPVSKNGALPIYIPLYKGAGALVSWLMFDTNQPTTDLSGLLNWFKQSQPAAKFYPGGLTNEVVAEGSRWVVPPAGTRVVNIPNGVVGFTNGNLTANFGNNVTLGTDNHIQNNSANALSMSIQTSKGLFTGSVTPPGGGTARSFKGALLQKQSRGAGFLTGTNETSNVSFR